MDMDVYYDATSSGDESPPAARIQNPFIPVRSIDDNPFGKGISEEGPIYIFRKPMRQPMGTVSGQDQIEVVGVEDIDVETGSDVVGVEDIGVETGSEEEQPLVQARAWYWFIMAVIYGVSFGLFVVLVRLLMKR